MECKGGRHGTAKRLNLLSSTSISERNRHGGITARMFVNTLQQKQLTAILTPKATLTILPYRKYDVASRSCAVGDTNV